METGVRYFGAAIYFLKQATGTMSIPEIVFGLVLPLLWVALITGLVPRFLPQTFRHIVEVAGIAIGLSVAQVGLLLVARKWARLDSAEAWSDLWESGVDKFLTPTIAADWLPIGFLGLAVLYVIGWSLNRRKVDQTNNRLSVGKVVFLVLQVAAMLGLVYAMLAGSKYISREPELWKKIIYVAVPALLLSGGWLVATFGSGNKRSVAGDMQTEGQHEPQESKLGWLTALAIVLSATLLILTSGAASIATQAMSAAIVPAVLVWTRSNQESIRSTYWLHTATGLIVVQSYFFAETPLYAGVAWFVSSMLLIRYWPNTDQSLGRRWMQSFAIAVPALSVAIYSAIQFAIAMSGSEY